MGHTKTMSSIVSAWVPLNAINFICAPPMILLRTTRCAERLNTCVLHFIYLPVAATGTVLFGALSLLCLPIANLM